MHCTRQYVFETYLRGIRYTACTTNKHALTINDFSRLYDFNSFQQGALASRDIVTSVLVWLISRKVVYGACRAIVSIFLSGDCLSFLFTEPLPVPPRQLRPNRFYAIEYGDLVCSPFNSSCARYEGPNDEAKRICVDSEGAYIL